MISSVDDHEDQGDELDSEDAFDRRWSNLLDAEADLLREKAMTLIETGAVTIERPGGVVMAQFRSSRRRQHGTLTWRRWPEIDIEAIPADGSGRAAAHGPMVAKYGDRANLIEEIMLAFAIHLAVPEEGG